MLDRRSRPIYRTLAVLFAISFVWAACTDAPQEPITSPELGAVAAPGQDAAYRAAVDAQTRHNPGLLARADVVGSGIGIDADGRYVVRLYVTAPGLANLPVDLDGVPVQSVVTGLIMATNVNDPTTKERPAPNGFSIGHPSITAGTLGAIVKNGAGQRFILSNNHVLANMNKASIGDPSYQPGPYDGGTSADIIGTLAAFHTINFSGGNNVIDAAITAVSGDVVTAATAGYSYGAPSTTTAVASLGQSVQKSGRTTGHTTGTVAEVNVTLDVCYETRGPFMCKTAARFVQQVAISDGSFSAGGDSGSLIVTLSGRNPVALLFAGSTTRTFANPIDAVLSEFGVTITDDPGDGGGTPVTTPPTASFTFSCSGLDCAFDASGTEAGSGTIQSYDWDFGGDGTGNGITPSHTFSGSGTYQVMLTVTTDDGSDQTSQNVSVSEPGAFTLSAQGYKERGLQKADLTWSGTSAANVDVYRDGSPIATGIANNDTFTDNIDQRGGGSYTYLVCEAGTSTCSNEATVTF